MNFLRIFYVLTLTLMVNFSFADTTGCMTASDCAYDSSATVQDDSACSGLSAGACEECSSTTSTSDGSCSDIAGWVDNGGEIQRI